MQYYFMPSIFEKPIRNYYEELSAIFAMLRLSVKKINMDGNEPLLFQLGMLEELEDEIKENRLESVKGKIIVGDPYQYYILRRYYKIVPVFITELLLKYSSKIMTTRTKKFFYFPTWIERQYGLDKYTRSLLIKMDQYLKVSKKEVSGGEPFLKQLTPKTRQDLIKELVEEMKANHCDTLLVNSPFLYLSLRKNLDVKMVYQLVQWY